MQDQNDNNVKMVILNKIIDLKKKYSKILQDYMPDILNIIREDTVQSVEINQKVLELVTDLINVRNVKEVGVFLNKEILKAKKLNDNV
jgi:coatomer subunit beta